MKIIPDFRKFWEDSKHVLSVSYKPKRDEFERTAKLVIFGILLVGAIGFIISIIVSLITTGTL